MSELERVKAGLVLRGHLTLEQVRDGLMDDEVLQCLYLCVPALIARIEQAEAEIAEFDAERAAWDSTLGGQCAGIEELRTERDSLQAEVERLTKRVEELEGLLKAERKGREHKEQF